MYRLLLGVVFYLNYLCLLYNSNLVQASTYVQVKREVLLFVSADQCFSCQRGAFNAVIEAAKSKYYHVRLIVAVERKGDLDFILPRRESLGFQSVSEDVGSLVHSSFTDSLVYPTAVVISGDNTAVIPDPLHNLNRLRDALTDSLNERQAHSQKNVLQDTLGFSVTSVHVAETDSVRVITPTRMIATDSNVFVLDAAQNRVVAINRRNGRVTYAVKPSEIVLDSVIKKLKQMGNDSIAIELSELVHSNIPFTLQDFTVVRGAVGCQYIAPFVRVDVQQQIPANASVRAWGSIYVVFNALGVLVNYILLDDPKINYSQFSFNDSLFLCSANTRMSYEKAQKGLQSETILRAAGCSWNRSTIAYGSCAIANPEEYSIVGRTKTGNIVCVNENFMLHIDVYNGIASNYIYKSDTLKCINVTSLCASTRKAVGSSECVRDSTCLLLDDGRVIIVNQHNGGSTINDSYKGLGEIIRDSRVITMHSNIIITLNMDALTGWTLRYYDPK